MRMLKRTSKHHQPAQLAAAVALGIVVGLVPKANLLAVGLYALLLVLPLHTGLALVVSLLVACIAGYLDPLTDALGSWLLHRPMLRSLWYLLDNTAVLPWLGLHNTVVVGGLATGVALSAPAYLVSLRAFDRRRSKAAALKGHELQETILLAPQPVESAIVPPPKFVDLPQSTATPAADEDFEPAREVAAIINSWHMGHAARRQSQSQKITATSGLTSPQEPPQFASGHPHRASAADGFQPRPFTPPPRPWAGERSEIVDSLDLAHNASEVLDWVDDMLKECLPEDGARIINVDPPSQATGASAHVAPAESPHQAGTGADERNDHDQEHWLMETTIEVVRWGDDSPPAIPPTVTHTPTEAPHAHSSVDAPPIAPASSDEASRDVVAPLPQAQGMPRRPSSSKDAGRSGARRGWPSIVPFVQPGAEAKQPPTTDDHSQQDDATQPPAGECLGYLLGHLRQEREGRSS